MKRVCVFCGSKKGESPHYENLAVDLADAIADRGWGMVYGGGNVGLMGVLADRVVERGAEAIGVIPESLAELELAHASLSELHVVETMHQRKALMAELADGFIALPGGIGTFEELFEILTWAHLGFHEKPIGILDDGCYYDPVFDLLDRAIDEGFLRRGFGRRILRESNPVMLLDQIADS